MPPAQQTNINSQKNKFVLPTNAPPPNFERVLKNCPFLCDLTSSECTSQLMPLLETDFPSKTTTFYQFYKKSVNPLLFHSLSSV